MGSYYGSIQPRRDFPKLVDLYLAGRLLLDELVSREYRLDEINSAFDDMLNGSNARLYRLAFRHGEQLLAFHVIGGDGGLLDRPRAVTEAFLSPSERLDVLLDLRAAAVGDAVKLVSLPFDPMHHDSGSTGDAHGGHGAHGMLPEGAEIEIMSILVSTKTAYDRALPQTLSRIAPAPEPAAAPRIITLDHLIEYLEAGGDSDELEALRNHRRTYGVDSEA